MRAHYDIIVCVRIVLRIKKGGCAGNGKNIQDSWGEDISKEKWMGKGLFCCTCVVK